MMRIQLKIILLLITLLESKTLLADDTVSVCSDVVSEIQGAIDYVGQKNTVFQLKRNGQTYSILFLSKNSGETQEQNRWRLIDRQGESINYCIRAEGTDYQQLIDMHNSNPEGRYGMPSSGYPRCSSTNETKLIGTLDLRMWANKELGESIIFYLVSSDDLKNYIFLTSNDNSGYWIMLDNDKKVPGTSCYYSRGDSSDVFVDYSASLKNEAHNENTSASTPSALEVNAEKGEADAQYLLGLTYFNTKDYKHAAVWFKKAAMQGNTKAQYYLGTMYAGGDGLEQDYDQARSWLLKASAQGNVDSQYLIGLMYLRGDGVTKDNKQASTWFEKSAEQGNATAQYILGMMYFNGDGVSQNKKIAVQWLEKSAVQENIKSQSFLGMMYEKGEDVPQDYSQALFWLEKAAAKNDAGAQIFIGIIYQGGEGVTQDLVEAHKWYDLAYVNGEKDANNLLKVIEHKMTTEQIAEARKRTREWKPLSSQSVDNAGTQVVPLQSGTQIALVSKNGVYEVPVILNDVLSLNFIIDSGAADVSISPDVALTLIKTGTVTKDNFLPGATYQFADGTTANSERFTLHSIKIGPKIITNVVCSITKSVDSPMLLGQSALQKLGAYKIDYKTGSMSIE